MTNKFFEQTDDRDRVSTDSDRKTYVREWIARRLKAGGAAGIGMVGTLLTLPMLAAAQVRESFVNATQIDGVDSVETMPDGSVQLSMDNGVTISVPAEDVQIAANGDVLVSDRIVDIAADVMAGGGAGGLGAGGIAAGLGGAAVAAAAAGGGGDGGGGPEPLDVLNGESFESQVLGVSGGFNSDNTGITLPEGTSTVTVTLTDGDGIEIGSGPAQIDTNGDWTFTPAGDLPQGPVTVTVRSLDAGGEELDSTSKDFNIDTVPPTITITDTGVGDDDVLNIAEQGAGITVSGTAEGAEGQTVTVTLSGATGATIVATGIVTGNAFSVEVSPSDLTGIGAWASATVTAEVSDAAGNPATPATVGFGIDVVAAITIDTIAGDPVAAADITAGDRVDGFDVTGIVTGVEDGQDVTVTLNGQDFTAPVSGGAFTVPISAAFLNGLDAGPVTLNVSASVTDVALNTATDTPAPIAADFTGPSITITPILTASGDATLNIAERTAGFGVFGTTDRVAPGSTVTVTVNGEALAGPVTVNADGTWSVPVFQSDGGAFPPNGPVSIEASVTDTGSSLPASAVPLNLDVDLEAPEVTITTPIAVDGVLNIAEQGDGITISGTTTGVEDGQSVTVTLSGSVGAMPIVGSATVTGNAFTVPFSSGDLTDIGAWPSATVTAEVTDAAGNPATSDPETLGIDLTPPTLSIGDISGDNQIGLIDVQGDLVITGTTNAEIGQPVTLTFNGQEFNGSVISNSLIGAEPNSWSVTVSKAAVQAVQDGAVDGLASVAVIAFVSDAAGNPATTPATTTISADFNGPSITIDSMTTNLDNVVNIVEQADPNEIIIRGGANNVEAGQVVTVRIDGLIVGTVAVDSVGFWQTKLSQTDFPALIDGGSVLVTADVSDLSGIAAPTAEQALGADFTAPTIAIDTISNDDFINIADNTLVISGTSTGVEAGQLVRVNVEGLGAASAEVGATGAWGVGFSGGLTAQWVTDVGDGATPNVTANVTDLAGNPATEASRSVTIDVSAPTITIQTLSAGDVMNAVEQGQDLVITGTAVGTDGANVTVTFNGTALAPVPVIGGIWTATVPTADLASLTDGQTVAITATASDPAGNPGNVASASFTTDFTAPTITLTESGVVTDGALNIADQGAGITFTGTTTGVEDGQQVAITLSGVAMAPPITVTGPVTGNAFTVEFTSDDLSTIGGWASANVTAAVSDAAGNPAPPATDSFAIDLVAPTIAFNDPPPAGFVLGIEDRDSLETEGVGVTTTEPDGTAVTLTFTRPDGSGGTVTDVTINTTVSNGGTFDIPLTPAQIAALQDMETYTLDLTITDGAGNTGTDQLTVPTDFAPILTIDEIGVDRAVDLSDTVDASITGTTVGVEENQDVTVTVTGATSGEVLNTTASVGMDGTWTLPLDATFFAGLNPGETFTVNATVTNAAGRMANANQAGIDAYEAALLLHANSDTFGSTLTIAAFGNDGFNSNDGFTTEITFTPAEALYNAGSATQNPGLALFIVNDTQAGSGNLVISGGSLTTPLPVDSVVYQFDVTDQGAGPITFNFQDRDLGGPSELLIGTSGTDTLIASNFDSVIQAKGGNDSIDVSDTGTNVVVFELDQASNGTDTVTGFTTGTTFQADEIAFLGQADLRGDGDFVQSMTTGEALGANTGFVIFTTALGDTGTATIDTALEGLTGEQAGDVFYALAGDGTAASLVLATVTAPDTITVQTLANFTDIGALTLLSPDNVILPDPVTAVV